MSTPSVAVIEPTLTVVLPDYLSKFSGRVLTLGESSILSDYYYDTDADKYEHNVLFDAGNFTNITFITDENGKHIIFALHEDLDSGPEYRINPDDPSYNTRCFALRNIVIAYLKNHPDCGYSINDFL